MLPKEAADLLYQEPAETQALVTTKVRQSLVYLDQLGVVLDPIQFEAVITLLVAQEIATGRQIKSLCNVIDYLRSRDGQT